jgi:hypothetical protein
MRLDIFTVVMAYSLINSINIWEESAISIYRIEDTGSPLLLHDNCEDASYKGMYHHQLTNPFDNSLPLSFCLFLLSGVDNPGET